MEMFVLEIWRCLCCLERFLLQGINYWFIYLYLQLGFPNKTPALFSPLNPWNVSVVGCTVHTSYSGHHRHSWARSLYHVIRVSNCPCMMYGGGHWPCNGLDRYNTQPHVTVRQCHGVTMWRGVWCELGKGAVKTAGGRGGERSVMTSRPVREESTPWGRRGEPQADLQLTWRVSVFGLLLCW